MTAYTRAGVDLGGADEHVARIAPLVTASWGSNVVGGFGGFAAGVELPPGYLRPVLMLSTDGVGTKLEIARQTGRWEGVGFDLVAMCVDDLAVVGARAAGFVDYMAVGSLQPARDTSIVASIAGACASIGVPLLGGETAEHPGVVEADSVDLAGAAMGVVEFGHEITGATIQPGDVILGIASPNLRSNGFSLVRKVVAGLDLRARFPGEDSDYAEVLLRPSVLYTPAVLAAMSTGRVHGAAHITGGGIAANLIRSLPRHCAARIDTKSWAPPNVFSVLAELGDIDTDSMFSTFNMGIGFCLVVRPADAAEISSLVSGSGHEVFTIGKIVAGDHSVALI